ncbi:MAG: NADH-quinone oxidoreductase subunit NuoH, partial [Bacillota bacterium]
MSVLDNLFVKIAALVRTTLTGLGLGDIWVNLAMVILYLAGILGVMMTAALVLVLVERKIAGFIQLRPGPNRVGPWGSLQTVADTIKLLTKEDIIPACADRKVFMLAPVLVLVPTILAFAVIPFGKGMIATDVNIGIFYLIAVSSLATIPFLMAGWSSNNKYSLLGGMRAVAQMVSYEVPMVFSLLGVVMIVGSLQMSAIVEAQSKVWFVLLQPVAFLIYVIAATAECNRAPFDIPEGESELVAGVFTEYTGMKWALFFLAEYANLVLVSAIATTMFLGGWHGPVLPG